MGSNNPISSSSNRQRKTVCVSAQGDSIDLSALGLEVPDIDAADIATYQEELGAEFNVSFLIDKIL